MGLVAMVAYFAMTPAVSGDKDSSEFVLVLTFAGVAHPTGYPIYTLLGHLWTQGLHALGPTWAYAANAWSAVGGGVAIALLHRLGCALIPCGAPLGRARRFLLATLPCALLFLNPIWTYETTLAEVYSWHVAWVLGACRCFVGLVDVLIREPSRTPQRLALHAAGWGVICGLGGAHHATSILVAVPLSVALLVVMGRERKLTVAAPLIALAGALIPLASYGFLLWRATHPAVVHWPAFTPGLSGLLVHVTGQQYRLSLGHFAASPEQARMLGWYGWPLLVPGLAMLAAMVITARGLGPRAVAWGLALAAACGTAYAFGYGVTDPSSYFLYPLVLGLAAAVPLAARMLSGAPRTRRLGGAFAAALALATAGLAVPWARTGWERIALYESFDRYLGSMWASIPVDTAFVFWANDMTYKLRERQLLRGEKPGLFVYHPLFLTNEAVRARFVARHAIDPVAPLAPEVRRAIVPGMPDALVGPVVAAVEHQVNLGSPLPVIHFDPERSSVRLLRKPGGPPPEREAP